MGGIIDVHEPMYKNNIKKKKQRGYGSQLYYRKIGRAEILDTQIRITVYFLTTKE